MNCKKCGKTIPENNNYCPACEIYETNNMNNIAFGSAADNQVSNNENVQPIQKQQVETINVPTQPTVEPTKPMINQSKTLEVNNSSIPVMQQNEPQALLEQNQLLLKKSKKVLWYSLFAWGIVLGIIIFGILNDPYGFLTGSILMYASPVVLILLITSIFKGISVIAKSIKKKVSLKGVKRYVISGLVLACILALVIIPIFSSLITGLIS